MKITLEVLSLGAFGVFLSKVGAKKVVRNRSRVPNSKHYRFAICYQEIEEPWAAFFKRCLQISLFNLLIFRRFPKDIVERILNSR